MDKKQTEALRIATESLPMLKIAASLGDETGQISFHSSHLLNFIEGYDAARQEIASLRAQLEAVATPAQPLHVAATSCPHEIDKDKIVLHFDSKQSGKNALAQLAARLQAAQAQHVHWVTPTIAQMKEYCKQASAMMARDLTRFDAACEVMGYLKEMRAPGYYMHRMNIVLHGNVEGMDAARASDKAPQPAAQALDSVRVFWQQHTQADALSMTMAELHTDVELVIRAARGSAQAAPVDAAVKPAINVGTIGHVGSGRTTLTAALGKLIAAQKGNHD